jgi:hypothetical protein
VRLDFGYQYQRLEDVPRASGSRSWMVQQVPDTAAPMLTRWIPGKDPDLQLPADPIEPHCSEPLDMDTVEAENNLALTEAAGASVPFHVCRDGAAHDEKIDKEYAMLDDMAAFMIRAISDQIWTEAVGRRTPFGKPGGFHDDDKPSSVDIEDLH